MLRYIVSGTNVLRLLYAMRMVLLAAKTGFNKVLFDLYWHALLMTKGHQ